MTSSIDGGEGTSGSQPTTSETGPVKKGTVGGEEAAIGAPRSPEEQRVDGIIAKSTAIIKELETITDELLMAESVQTFGTPMSKEDKKKLEKALSDEAYLPPEEGEPVNYEELNSESKFNPLFQNIPYNRIVANAHEQQRMLSQSSIVEMNIQVETLMAELLTAKDIGQAILAAAKVEKEGLMQQAYYKIAAGSATVVVAGVPMASAGYAKYKSNPELAISATAMQPISQIIQSAEGAASSIQQADTVYDKAEFEQLQQVLQSAQKNLQSMMENASQDRRQMVGRISDVLQTLNKMIDEQARTHGSLTAQHS